MSHATLPDPLRAATDAVPETSEVTLDGQRIRSEPLVLEIERGAEAGAVTIDASTPATLQLARASDPRLILGFIPVGDRHWLHVQLRTSRERLFGVRAIVEPDVVEGLPWRLADERLARVPSRDALQVIKGALGADARLASWSAADAKGLTERRDDEDEAPEAEAEEGPPGKLFGVIDRGNLGRHIAATVAATLPAITWFVPVGSLGLTVVPLLVSFLIVCALTAKGPPQAMLAIVYGGLGVAAWGIGAHVLDLWNPPSPHETYSHNATRATLDDDGFHFTDTTAVHPDLAASATADGETCWVTPVAGDNWAPGYGLNTFVFCCDPDPAVCGPQEALGDTVVRAVDKDALPTAAAEATRVLSEERDIGVTWDENRWTHFEVLPDALPERSMAKIIGFGLAAWLFALVLANALVHFIRPLSAEERRTIPRSSS